MPDPDRLVSTIRRACRAFRDTPGRRGRFVDLDADEVLASGDLHGSVENFRLLLTRADLARNPRRHLVLQELVHGPFTYPGGGDKSHQTLDLLAALKCQYPRQVHMLLGNHELAQWAGRLIAKGDTDLNLLFREGVSEAYGVRAEEVLAAYNELFAAIPLAVRTPNRVFLSHSLPTAAKLPAFDFEVLYRDEYSEADLASGGAVHALVWGRDTREATVTAFLERVGADLLVTGHIPCDAGFEVPNNRQLILDSLGTPACYCLFPANRPLTHEELVACVGTL